jgi:hypothetical protein
MRVVYVAAACVVLLAAFVSWKFLPATAPSVTNDEAALAEGRALSDQ